MPCYIFLEILKFTKILISIPPFPNNSGVNFLQKPLIPIKQAHEHSMPAKIVCCHCAFFFFFNHENKLTIEHNTSSIN